MLIELDQKKLKLKQKVLMNIHSPKNDIGVSSFLSKNNIWEPFETSIFLKLISKKKFFLDIGANLGYYSIIASKLISKLGKVVAIEPERLNLELLYQNLEMNNILNVDVIEKACSDNSHATFLKLSKDNLGDHRLSNKKNKDSKNIEIKASTVDSIINEYGLIPDIVKIDTQGAELKIIKGMKNLLHNSNLKTTFFMEFWPDGLNEQGDKISELIEYISLKSFVMFALFEENGLLVKVKKQDLIRWSSTLMNINSSRYSNLIIAHKKNESFSRYLSSLKLKKFQFNTKYKSVVNKKVSKLLIPVGWSFAESDGVWSDGLFSEIIIQNITFKKGKDYTLVLNLIPILNKSHSKINLKISFNSIYCSTIFLEDANQFNNYSIIIPKKIISHSSESFVISFDFSDGVKPVNEKKKNDARLLSAKINSFGIFEFKY